MLVKEPSAISFYKHFLLPAFHSAPIVNGEVTPGHLFIFKFPATSQTHCNLDNPVWHRRNVPHTMETNTNHVQFPQLVLGRFPAPSPAHSPLEDRAGSPLPAQPPALGVHWTCGILPGLQSLLTPVSSVFCHGPHILLLPRAALQEPGWGAEPGQCSAGGWRVTPWSVRAGTRPQCLGRHQNRHSPTVSPTACPKATGQG